MANYNIHTGNLIKTHLEKQERTKHWLAQKVGIDPSNFNRLLQKQYIDTDKLMKISLALKVDFFALLSQEYNKEQGFPQ
jgi:DNA-binding Xre family transcriptional regulator